ncbi:hypothetical protein [Methylobacterium sp. Leaf118]|uniref:hypothetical protein n=1 Tax=Methylobacterium sp. Leaf118 TaxID=2876562 RepID=UPI001E658348|nr:hypothetical protein [Methylobacterium sp. Leaf118]
MFDQVVPLITEAPRRWFFVTVIFEEHRYQRGELHKFDPKKLIERFRAALRKVGIEHIVAFGGLDYCEETRMQDFNSSPTYTWCVHTHHLVYVSDEKAEELRRILRERFRDSPYARRPVQFARHKADKYTIFQATSYCVKSVYNSAIVARSPSGQSARKKGRKRLHGKSQAELAAFQARQNLGDRVLLVGLKRNQKSIIRTRTTPTITAAGFKAISYLNVPIRKWDDFSSIV